MASAPDRTGGHLLDGRIRYAQPRSGFRSGIEPVLLAASVPARPGARVLEGGSGAAAALLCLAFRVPGVQGQGIDQDPTLVALARENAIANGFSSLHFVVADIASIPASGEFDHAFANPPYHGGGGTQSPNASRQAAKSAAGGLPTTWAAALARALRPRGTLTFILSAARLPEAAAAFADVGCRPVSCLPLWPKAGQAAKLLLLRGVKGSRAPFRLLPGLVLHEPNGSFTAETEAILRGGAALEL